MYTTELGEKMKIFNCVHMYTVGEMARTTHCSFFSHVQNNEIFWYKYNDMDDSISEKRL